MSKDQKRQQLRVNKFNIRDIRDDSVVLMIGKRGTGKSTLIKDMLYHHQGIPAGVVMSGSENVNHYYEEFIPKMLIYDEFASETAKNFYERQLRIKNQKDAEVKSYGRSDVDPRAFLIMDDLMFDKSWINDKNIRYVFLNGRHISCLFTLSLQYPLGIPPTLRTNVDYIFIMRENIVANRKRIYEQFAGMLDSFETFCTVLDACTQNYECLVINNKTLSNNISDQIYWYKAEPRPNFKMCSQEFWDIQALDEEHKSHNRKGNGFVEEDPDYNPNDLRKKKPYHINVRKM